MDPLELAGVEYQAQAHADTARVSAQVADFVGAQQPAAPTAPAKTKEQIDAEQLAAAAEAALPQIALIAWKMADKAIQSFGGAHCAADRDELDKLAELSVPVLNKYLGSLSGFFTTPEGVLLAVATLTYGPKLIAGPPSAPRSGETDPANSKQPPHNGSPSRQEEKDRATTTAQGATA